MILGTEFSTSLLGTPGKTMLIWRLNKKKKRMTRMFLRKFELKLNGNRGQELQTSVRVAPLHAILKISAEIQVLF